jgi:gas vesicle protein
MGQDPDTIRREIEQTRERMGDTVDALGYKADVPSRTKEAVTGRVQSVKEKVVGAAGSVNEATPGTQDIKRGASVAQQNPLGLAIGSIAVGFLAGMLIPATRVENEKIGPAADQLKEQAREAGQEALDRAQTVAQEVAGTAKEAAQQAAEQVKETAQSSSQEQASGLKDSVTTT